MIRRHPKLFKWIGIIAGSLAALFLVAILTLVIQQRRFEAGGNIAVNVSVAGVPVTGLGAAEAVDLVTASWVPSLPEKITVKAQEQIFEVTPEEIGARLEIDMAVDRALLVGREGTMTQKIVSRLRLLRSSIDIPVERTVNDEALEQYIAEVAEKINRDPVNATIEVLANDEVRVIPGKVGLKLDKDASFQLMVDAMQVLDTAEVELLVKKTDPDVKAADLAHLEVVLATYSTRFNPGQKDRTHNLRLAINAVHKTVVMPGEEFSLNRVTGQRLAEKGYREAPIFVDGEISPATGGGICQIATTIYNTALLAGLQMVQRHHHSRPVDYAPAGRDATVYWGQIDLRFRNNTGAPIVILGSMGERTVTVKIIGKRDAKKRVEIVTGNRTEIPFEVKETPDPELEEGKREVEKKGRAGIRVTVYRDIYDDAGNRTRQTLHTDTYRPQAEEVRVGTKKPETPVEEAPKPNGGNAAGTAARPPASPPTGEQR